MRTTWLGEDASLVLGSHARALPGVYVGILRVAQQDQPTAVVLASEDEHSGTPAHGRCNQVSTKDKNLAIRH